MYKSERETALFFFFSFFLFICFQRPPFFKKMMPPRIDLKKSKALQVPAGPPSPSLSTASFMSSISWMAEKTSSELIPMLKNAYSALKDKEKGTF